MIRPTIECDRCRTKYYGAKGEQIHIVRKHAGAMGWIRLREGILGLHLRLSPDGSIDYCQECAEEWRKKQCSRQ